MKIDAIRWRILRLKRTKFDFGWGYAPDPAGQLTALPQAPLLDLGAASRQGGGWAGEEEGKREGKGREGEVEGRAPKLLLNQLRDLLRHWVTSQILMLPGLNKLTSIIVNIVFTM